MSLKLRVGVCRKVGLPDYCSVGADCSIEIELDWAALANPERLRSQIRDAQQIVATAVEEELARQQGQVQQPAASERINAGGMGSNGAGYQKEHRDWQGGYKPEPSGNGHPERGPGGDRGGAPPAQRSKSFSGPPKSGRALYSWAKRQDDERGTAFVKWLNGWGKRNDLDGRMSEWPDDAAQAAHRELMAANDNN